MQLNSAEAAKILGVSPATVGNLVRKGKLRARNIGTGRLPRYRFEPADIEAQKVRQVVNPEQGVTPA